MNKKRKIVYGGALLLLLAAIIICILRWKVWFGQPEEEPYGVSEKPWRVLLTFGSEESERMLSWQCDSVLKEAWVEISESAESSESSKLSKNSKRIPAKGEIFQSRAGKAACYYASLKNLKPGQRYDYRVVTGGKASEKFSFAMPAFSTNPAKPTSPSARDFSFIFVGDVQDTIDGEANKFLRQAFALNKDAEFLACGGDLTERPRDKDWAQTFRGLDSLKTTVPILAITGNHDYLKELPRRLERRFSLVFPYFLESMVDENQVFTLRYGNAQFFLLDSDRELPFLLTQKEWLEKELEKSTAKWKIVLCHHPLYSLRGNNNLIQRWVFADLIESRGVDLVLQGHEHNYARMTKGKTIYTVSHCSPKTYSHKDLSRFEKTALDSRFYQKVRIKGDSLFLTAYEVYKNELVDSLCVVR